MCMDGEGGVHSVLFSGGSEDRCRWQFIDRRASSFSGLLFNRDQWGNRCGSNWRDELVEALYLDHLVYIKGL